MRKFPHNLGVILSGWWGRKSFALFERLGIFHVIFDPFLGFVREGYPWKF